MSGDRPRFASALLSLGILNREDSAYNFAEVAKSFALQPEDRFGIKELSERAADRRITARTVRHVLRRSRYNENIRATLLTAIRLDEVVLLWLFTTPTDTRRRKRDAFVLEVVARSTRVLVDAHRAQPGFAAAMTRYLLRVYAKACKKAGWHPIPLPPLVVLDKRLGEDPRFRAGIAGVAAEYVLEVDRPYLYRALRRGTYEPRGHLDVLEPVLVSPADGSPPPPQLLKIDAGPGGEFGCELEIGGRRRFFVVRPWLPDCHGSAPIDLLAARALELVKLVAELPQTSLAEEFRIAYFMPVNDEQWRRGVRLRALYEAVRTGLLPPHPKGAL